MDAEPVPCSGEDHTATFLILTHECPEQLGRLVASLQAPWSRVIVMVDRGVDEAPFRAACRGLEVAWIPRRHRVDVVWAAWSGAHATWRLLAAASGEPSDHTVVLAGKDMLVRPLTELRAYLGELGERSKVNLYNMSEDPFFSPMLAAHSFRDLTARLPWPETAARWERRVALAILHRCGPRRFPRGFVPYRGSTRMVLSREALLLIVRAWRTADGRRLRRYLRTVMAPDEIVFPTLLGNSPLAARIVRDDDEPCALSELMVQAPTTFTYADWSSDREDPAILDGRDVEAVRGSGAFFALKVVPGRSDAFVAAFETPQIPPARP